MSSRALGTLHQATDCQPHRCLAGETGKSLAAGVGDLSTEAIRPDFS